MVIHALAAFFGFVVWVLGFAFVVAVCAVIASVPLSPWFWLANRRRLPGSGFRPFWAPTLAAALLTVVFTYSHYSMSSAIQPLAADFQAVARGEYPGYTDTHELNYHGKLDIIRVERNRLLRQHHYTMLGAWRVSGSWHDAPEDLAITTDGFYLWLGFLPDRWYRHLAPRPV